MSNLRLLALPALLLFAIACDSDGDGLSNSEEKKLGTDPDVADSDGDGLTDGEEAELGSDALNEDSDNDGLLDGDEADFGSDPNEADTDGDGYSDYSEFQADTDPDDANSVIYQGGWPHNPFKDGLSDPGLDGGDSVGDRLPRRSGGDQHGEIVDLYDFAGQGKPILIDVSAEWCPPCRDMAQWLEGQSMTYNEFNNVRRAVNRGEVYWITMMPENNSGGQATPVTVATWAEEFPNEHVPIIVDRQKALTGWANLQYFPSTMMLDENMDIMEWSPANPTNGLEALSTYCSDNGLGERLN